jgi:cell division protein FtsL
VSVTGTVVSGTVVILVVVCGVDVVVNSHNERSLIVK